MIVKSEIELKCKAFFNEVIAYMNDIGYTPFICSIKFPKVIPLYVTIISNI